MNHFTALYSDNGNGESANEVLEVFNHHAWLGNVRELENEVRRLVVLPEAGIPDVPKEFNDQSLKLDIKIQEFEKKEILDTLRKCSGNRRETAELLGISEPTLCRKIKFYNILT